MELALQTSDLLGYAAGACTLAAFSMRRMIPLRIAGVAANGFFIAYGILADVHPALLLHSVLLPLNVTRLVQMLRLVRNVRVAASGTLSMQWLERFMSSRRCAAGEVLFRKGDVATHMFYVVGGRFRLPELSLDIVPGEVIGEMGIISPGNRRTQSLTCIEDGELLTVTYDQVRQLYFQNPHFGFYLLRLIGERMFENLERHSLEREAALMPGK